MSSSDWNIAFKPLLKKYRGRQHPLDYKNVYQLLVMVVLSARDSDKNINALAPHFFKLFPDMKSLAAASDVALFDVLKKVRGGKNKAIWLRDIAAKVKTDANIPLNMDDLIALPGIGRKSANVIMREAKVPAEGVIVDLHVVRVAPRIGVASGSDPKKIEAQLMDAIPKKDWSEIGMAISFLGRETCRPSHPEHDSCVMSNYCEFFKMKRTGKNAGPENKTASAIKTGNKLKVPSSRKKQALKTISSGKKTGSRK